MGINALSIDDFLSLDDAECERRIVAAKAALGERLVILGHHYQREEVFKHADFSGDSLKLSRQAAQSGAEYIVFCGVHFMAEVADILSAPEQIAILPDLAAGCSMADMADIEKVDKAWGELSAVLDPDQDVTPITYINSAADLKAFCGSHGGIVCTSSNAEKVLEWAFNQREKVLFFPDQHLGRNTGFRMGMRLEEMVTWDFDKPNGGLSEEDVRKAKIILWDGFCSVHQQFHSEHIDQFRASYPDGKVIAHPECAYEVCEKSDEVGSTELIIKKVKASAAGSRWLVGTEVNLVNRLAQECKAEGKFVHYMAPIVCMCSTMYRIDPQHLLWILENLVKGNVVNQIKVLPEIADQARLALERMLAVSY
ncbi:MAG: quinolinate synthase [Candidatus Parabeggiatoa sp. nov. 3]|nr:MAG: quinolinate synthase [Gammaproteobacteria bacterium]RKZ62338.1 MAG: quinolinate synthase [Gammaproteobacteria bacterium]RKZ76223.1 MAG: quinolinate synthase [Gammaproteobacteria bacterium]